MCLFEKQISILFMNYGHSVQICAFALRFFVYKSKNVLTTVAISCILSSSHNVTLHVITIDYVLSYARFYKRVVPSMLIVSQHMLRETELEAPEAYRGKVRLYSIRYKSDDCEVEGYAAVPAQFEDRLPALIFNRGGNREFGALKPSIICRLAAAGFAAFGSQYRGNCGGTGREEFGGSDVNDITNLITIALEQGFTRDEAVYMIGRSRGGMMTYLTCARDTRVRAAVVAAGLADSFTMYYRFDGTEFDMKQDCNELIGGSPVELYEEYVKRSPICWADRILCPVLIEQGTDDWRVTPGQAFAMDRALTAAGKEHKFIVYEGGDHSLEKTAWFEDAIAWLNAHPL